MNPCAWCDRESGAVRPAGASHGICAMHAAIEVNAAKREALAEEMAALCPVPFERYKPRALTVEWGEAKRPDQLVFSVAVLLASAGAGIIFGALACAWEFAR